MISRGERVKKILLIGESCRDKTVYGKCERICPEAPVPVFEYEHEETTMGMAFNVKNNMEAMDSTLDITLITNWQELPVKTRYVDSVSEQMLLRVDQRDIVSPIDMETIRRYNKKDFDAVVISDYDKGFLQYGDIAEIADKIYPVFMDTKKVINCKYFNNVNFIKINEKEEGVSATDAHVADAGENGHHSVITTLGKGGARYNGVEYPVPEVEVRDVCGAGDTFLAALVVNFLEVGDITEAIKFANTCASEVVRHPGVTVYGYYH